MDSVPHVEFFVLRPLSAPNQEIQGFEPLLALLTGADGRTVRHHLRGYQPAAGLRGSTILTSFEMF